MNTHRFTADASLYRTLSSYRAAGSSSKAGIVIPQHAWRMCESGCNSAFDYCITLCAPPSVSCVLNCEAAKDQCSESCGDAALQCYDDCRANRKTCDDLCSTEWDNCVAEFPASECSSLRESCLDICADEREACGESCNGISTAPDSGEAECPPGLVQCGSSAGGSPICCCGEGMTECGYLPDVGPICCCSSDTWPCGDICCPVGEVCDQETQTCREPTDEFDAVTGGFGDAVRGRCGPGGSSGLNCDLTINCSGKLCALTDCGKGTCDWCPGDLGNLIVKGWCAYSCFPTGQAFYLISRIGGWKFFTTCLE